MSEDLSALKAVLDRGDRLATTACYRLVDRVEHLEAELAKAEEHRREDIQTITEAGLKVLRELKAEHEVDLKLVGEGGASLHALLETEKEKVAALTRELDGLTKGPATYEGARRWEVGLRNIVTILVGPSAEFEIRDIVEKVRALAKERDELRALVDDERDQAKKLKEELENIHGALLNYEANGSDAVAQIKGIYSDLEGVTQEMRALHHAGKALLNVCVRAVPTIELKPQPRALFQKCCLELKDTLERKDPPAPQSYHAIEYLKARVRADDACPGCRHALDILEGRRG